MPRKPNPLPSYRLHKQSGQAVCTVRGADGRRRDVLLGRYNSPESKAEYERLLATLRVAPAPPAGIGGRSRTPGLSVNELLLAFLTHAAGYYRGPDGKPTSELKNFRDALRPVRVLFGPTPAAEFGPLALKAVRQSLIDNGLSRPVINKAVGRVKRVFKWAAGEELIPFEAFNRLTAVAGLGKGRTTAREPDPVKPVAADTVAATLPFLNRQTAAMVRLQQLAGMRPGEVCRMTAADLDRSGPVWVYQPHRHKTLHRGKVRRVKLGGQAQAVLAPFLANISDPAAPLFSPRQAREERFAAMRTARKSKVTPCQVDRSKPNPKRSPAAAYSPHSFAKAVERAARRAGTAHWHPNQLRHTFATEVRKRHGLEAAQVLLGHAKADVTQLYAERDDGLADAVAAADG